MKILMIWKKIKKVKKILSQVQLLIKQMSRFNLRMLFSIFQTEILQRRLINRPKVLSLLASHLNNLKFRYSNFKDRQVQRLKTESSRNQVKCLKNKTPLVINRLLQQT